MWAPPDWELPLSFISCPVTEGLRKLASEGKRGLHVDVSWRVTAEKPRGKKTHAVKAFK